MKKLRLEKLFLLATVYYSCGKVMFSQACVSHCVHREVPSLAGGAILRTTPPRVASLAQHPQGWQRRATPLYGQQEGGMHPTGMLSCYSIFFCASN